MQQNNIKDRQKVSDLIFSVLTQKICVRQALERFPKNNSDTSVKIAWHAIVHYEADEDFRKKDLGYKKEQDDYLEMIAFILKEGKELPRNIIDEYNEYYDESPVQHSKGFLNTVKSLLRFIH